MQSPAERRREAYLHQLRKTGQLKAYDFKERDMVPIHNPHIVEENGHWLVKGDYNGHHLSRFIKPPPKH